MKTKRKQILATKVIAMGIVSTASVAMVNAGEETSLESTAMMEKTAEPDFLQPFGSIRARYEIGDVDGFQRSTVGSLRTRVGLKTKSIGGLSFLVEGEHTYILTSGDNYRPFPGFAPGNRSVIADPDNLQLNRLQLMYHSDALKSTFVVGRQLIAYDDERFIGSIPWRQNDQTFDAIRLENQSIDNLKFSYAYVSQVNRIFGAQTPARGLKEWDSDSHLIQFEYTGIKDHKVRAFGYLLDFDNAAANSSNTFGLEVAGTRDSNIGKLNYLFTGAVQTDAGDNTVDYQEYYLRGQLGVTKTSYNYGVGVEMMTSDGVGRFRIPLGTNHKFNGFADAFLTTPANGLVDTYVWVGTKAFGAKHKLALHNFQSEEVSASLGWEIDYVAAKKIYNNTKAVFKFAYLNGDNAQPDTTRASLELNYSF